MTYPFTLQPLNYAYDALEPYMDAETMEIHHTKHLNTYMTNLNVVLEKNPRFRDLTAKQLLVGLNDLPDHTKTVVKNNAGGVYNHVLFFDLMKKGVPETADGPLYDAIVSKFGSMRKFKEAFKNEALSVFGSGWVFLVSDESGALSLVKTANQDVPDLATYTPIIAIDVWEHAYYLKNQNRRPEYVDHFLHVLNWSKAEENYSNR